MMHYQAHDLLSPEQIQLFLASLSGKAPVEARMAKLLYLRNAISEYSSLRSSFEALDGMRGCMSFIPIFWPVMSVQKRMMTSRLQLRRDRIQNALDVWREDLRGERFLLDGEELVA